MFINKLNPNFNFNNIDKDYIILKVVNKDESSKYPYGEIILNKFQKETGCRLVSSVNKNRGKPCLYLLLDKKSYEFNKIRSFFDNKFSLIQVSSESVDCDILCQLFINIFNGYEYKKFENITGRLFLVIKKDDKKEIIVCLEIYVDENLLLHLNTVTFSLMNSFNIKNSKGNYRWQFIQKGQTMSRIEHCNDNIDKNIYVQKGFKDTKQLINFLGFKTDDSEDTYLKSKIGKLSEVLSVINFEFKDYVNFKFEKSNMEMYRKTNTDSYWRKECKFNDLISEINLYGLNIVNKINCDTSLFCEYLDFKKIKYEFSNDLKKDKFNVIIIHDKDYYKINKVTDEHKIYKEYIVSHITLENSIKKIIKQIDKKGKVKWKGTAFADVILKELIIKKDLLLNKKITILNTDSLGIDDYFIFANYNKEKDLIGFVKFNNESLEYFDQFSEKAECYEDIIDYLYDNDKDIIVFYKDNILAIQDTELYPMLNLEKCYEFFINGYGLNILFKKSFIVKHLNIIADEYKTKKTANKKIIIEKYKELFEEYKDDDNNISYIDFCDENDIEKDNKVILSIFNDCKKLCYNNYRNREVVDYLYSELVGINYFEKNDEKYYWVGILTTENFTAIDKAPIIRRVKVLQGEDIFIEKIAPLLKVEFVKWAEQTVYPFPLKYLREAFEYFED